MSNEVATIEQMVYAVEPAFNEVAVDNSISFAREAGFALQIINANDFLAKTCRNRPQSLRDAVTNVAALGVSLNPAKKQAYLVPRDGKVCLDISYMGLLDLAVSSGSIQWGQARLVRQGDTFLMNGIDKAPTHEFNPFTKEKGAIVGAYVTVKTAEGDYLTEAMSIDEVYEIRNRSSAWKAYVKDKTKRNPWVTDEGEMIRKTVIKRAAKTWPRSERVMQATHHLNTDGDEGMADVIDGEVVETFDLKDWLARLENAATVDTVAEVKQAGLAEIARVKDAGAYKVFKTAANQRGKALMAESVERDPGEEG